MSSSKKTFIWVSSKKSQGLGHFYRNYFIYEKIENSYYFFNESLEFEISEKHIVFESGDAETILNFLIQENVGFLIIDHYFLEPSLYKKILKCEKIEILSFYKDKFTPLAKNIINNNPFVDKLKFPQNIVKQKFLGEAFYGFRQKIEQYKNITKKVDQVFICFGGSDHLELSLKILDKLSDNFKYKIVLGPACDKKYFNKVNAKFKNIALKGEVLKSPINFFELLAESTRAVISSSTICYEASYLNTPFVAIETADNQNELVDYLNDQEIRVLSVNELEKLDSIEPLIEKVNILSCKWSRDVATLLSYINKHVND